MTGLLLALSLSFPTPPELTRPPEMTDYGRGLKWWHPDRYTAARHEGRDEPQWDEPQWDAPDWPALSWKSSRRRLRIATVWFDESSAGGWKAVCDDPCCPTCAEAVYLPRR